MRTQIVALARQIVAMKTEKNCEQEATPYGNFDQD